MRTSLSNIFFEPFYHCNLSKTGKRLKQAQVQNGWSKLKCVILQVVIMLIFVNPGFTTLEWNKAVYVPLFHTRSIFWPRKRKCWTPRNFCMIQALFQELGWLKSIEHYNSLTLFVANPFYSHWKHPKNFGNIDHKWVKSFEWEYLSWEPNSFKVMTSS